VQPVETWDHFLKILSFDGIHQKENICNGMAGEVEHNPIRSGLPSFASLTIGAFDRGEILATQPYHTTVIAQILDDAEAQEFLNIEGLVGGRTPMWYRYPFLRLMFKENLWEEWAVNPDKVYDSVLQYLFHQRAE
jgi:hypothetical protein